MGGGGGQCCECGGFGCGASLHRFVVMMGGKLCLAVGCFRAFVWHLSLSVVAAREHLWRSSLRGVGGDSVEAVRVSCAERDR